jgi:membrane-associated phospholipid phosphatase
MISIPLITIINTSLNRYRGEVHILKTFIDDAITFEKVFIIPYLSWFAFFIGILVYMAIVDGKNYFRLLASLLVGNLICFIFYYFYPTTVPRPEVYGDDIFSALVRLTYSSDNPFNCFPSIHVLNALLCSMFLWRYSKNIFARAFAVFGTVIISASTLYVKQHYFPDVVSAAIVGIAMYVVFTNDYIWNAQPIKRVMAFFLPPKVKEAFIKQLI